MYDLEAIRVLHEHDGRWVPMEEHSTAAHAPAADDIERDLIRGARIYRCSVCDDQVAVVPSAEERKERG